MLQRLYYHAEGVSGQREFPNVCISQELTDSLLAKIAAGRKCGQFRRPKTRKMPLLTDNAWPERGMINLLFGDASCCGALIADHRVVVRFKSTTGDTKLV